MTQDYTLFSNRAEWRSWLEEHHDSESVVWVGYYKKHVKKATITYNEVVEEAICFGWIDGQIRRIDDEIYIQRFTPRKPNSKWSQLNLDRVKKMINAGMMTPAGNKAVEEGKRRGLLVGYTSKKEFSLPNDLADALKQDPAAWKNFNSFPPSSQFNYIGWVEDAKREETRKRRIVKVVERSKKNQKPGMI